MFGGLAHVTLCLLMGTLAWDGERMTRTLRNPMVLCSSKKWHHSLYLIQTSKKWPLKENTEGELESERQWGIPADARAEGTVTWASLLCGLLPCLFSV